MNQSKKVTLFIPCLVDSIYPEVGEAMVQVLGNLGLTLDCPLDQTCCGQPAFNSGYRKEARTAAMRFMEVFQDAQTIVCPSGSCVDMVRNHYAELFKGDPQWLTRVKKTSRKTFEFSEYLVDVLGLEDVGARYDGRVTYHDSCHLLRNLGVKEQPRRLIAHVRGSEMIEMKDSYRCCGFGGTFAVQYPDISTAILEDKVQHIITSGADAVVGCDISCLMNIQGLLSRKGVAVQTMHIAQLLAR